MIFLILAILFNAYLAVVFKIFPKFRIDTFQAIVFNYITCVATGSVYIGSFPIGKSSFQEPWIFWAMGMGVGFVTLFNLIGISTEKAGVAATSVANKLSLIIPALFAVWLYHEPLTWTKILGLALAIPAVWLAVKPAHSKGSEKSRLLLPLVIFVGSGLLDTAVNHVTQTFFDGGDTFKAQASYLVHSFATAATIGFVILLVQYLIGKRRFEWRHLIAGILLGIPNFFSIYTVIRLLHSDFIDSSAAIPATNIGVVLVATATAMIFFKEEKTAHRLLGIGLAVAALTLLILS